MTKLGPLIGRSPRAAKRFVNLYRLYRAGPPDSLSIAGAWAPPATGRSVTLTPAACLIQDEKSIIYIRGWRRLEAFHCPPEASR